MLKINIYTL